MRRLILMWQLCAGLGLAEWMMFSDGVDTYIYNNQSGEIFIRHHMGKQNYEDIFVKMPRGVLPNELKSTQVNQTTQAPTTTPTHNPPPSHSPNPTDENLEQRKLDALKKSQEVLNNALDF